MKIDELNSKDHGELLQILGEDILERYNNEEYWDRDIIENYLIEKKNITMKKYKVKRVIEFEVEAENEEEAKTKSAEKDMGDWAEAEVEELPERFCVKCGKTSGLLEDEDICYTCAKERGRI